MESDNLHQSGFNSTTSTYHSYHLCKNNQFPPNTSHNNKLSNFPQKNASGKQDWKEWRNTSQLEIYYFNLPHQAKSLQCRQVGFTSSEGTFLHLHTSKKSLILTESINENCTYDITNYSFALSFFLIRYRNYLISGLVFGRMSSCIQISSFSYI